MQKNEPTAEANNNPSEAQAVGRTHQPFVLPEIFNGQVWRQLEFPCFTVMVLMLSHVDGSLKFCKVAFDSESDPPGLMTEENGRWMYDSDELLEQLRSRKYTEIGVGRVRVVENPTGQAEAHGTEA